MECPRRGNSVHSFSIIRICRVRPTGCGAAVRVAEVIETDHGANLTRLAVDGALLGLHDVLRGCRHAACQELFRGEVVESGRLRAEAHMDASYQRCGVELLVQHLRLGGTTLLVLDGGIEDAQSVKFHADTLGYQLGYALGDLHQNGLNGVETGQTDSRVL